MMSPCILEFLGGSIFHGIKFNLVSVCLHVKKSYLISCAINIQGMTWNRNKKVKNLHLCYMHTRTTNSLLHSGDLAHIRPPNYLNFNIKILYTRVFHGGRQV